MEGEPSDSLVAPAELRYFPLSGRKHKVRLKLRGCNDKGVGEWVGKTLPKKSYQPQLERVSFDGLTRESPVALGVMQDLLAAQRAELLDEIRRTGSALEAEHALRRAAFGHQRHAVSELAQRELKHKNEMTALEQAFATELLAQESATKDAMQALRRKEAMISRRDSKLKDADAALKVKMSESTEAMSKLMLELEELSDVLEAKEAELSDKDFELSRIATEAEATGSAMEEVVAELTMLKLKRKQYTTTLNRLKSRLGGRKPVQRTDEELKQLASTGLGAHCKRAMTERVLATGTLGTHGESDAASVTAIADALTEGGFLRVLFESKAFWCLRMEWLEEVSELLALSWDAQLTFRLKYQLNLSEDKVDQLRYALSHHRVGKRLVPRPWVVNPWSGTKLNYPQPIKARSQWTPLVNTFITEHGLRMDSAGTIAQRSLRRVISEQHACDVGRGYLLSIPEEAPFLIPVLGADGFTADNNSMMHVGVPLRGH